MIERGIHNQLASSSAIQLYRLQVYSKKIKSHKPAMDHKPGSGVGAAYRAQDSNSPNEVSFIASSEWVGLGKSSHHELRLGFGSCVG
jgi:hypothetical protein